MVHFHDIGVPHDDQRKIIRARRSIRRSCHPAS
jgi:hypothetical protein